EGCQPRRARLGTRLVRAGRGRVRRSRCRRGQRRPLRGRGPARPRAVPAAGVHRSGLVRLGPSGAGRPAAGQPAAGGPPRGLPRPGGLPLVRSQRPARGGRGHRGPGRHALGRGGGRPRRGRGRAVPLRPPARARVGAAGGTDRPRSAGRPQERAPARPARHARAAHHDPPRRDRGDASAGRLARVGSRGAVAPGGPAPLALRRPRPRRPTAGRGAGGPPGLLARAHVRAAGAAARRDRPEGDRRCRGPRRRGGPRRHREPQPRAGPPPSGGL
ncbi:MAG: hypothetical protein AVDCRST_MAG16-2054, partial [uncultured Frankineae bacterium]